MGIFISPAPNGKGAITLFPSLSRILKWKFLEIVVVTTGKTNFILMIEFSVTVPRSKVEADSR